MKLHGITQFEKNCTGLLGLVVQHYRAGVRLKRRMGRLLLALLVLLFGRILHFLMSFLCLDFPTPSDEMSLGDSLSMAPKVEDDDFDVFGLSETGSNAECHELVSSEHSEESSKQSMAGDRVGSKLPGSELSGSERKAPETCTATGAMKQTEPQSFGIGNFAKRLRANKSKCQLKSLY